MSTNTTGAGTSSLASDKAWSTIAIGVAGFAGALLPRCVGNRGARVLSGATLFSAGVLLSAGLVHLLPDAIDGALKVAPDMEFPLMESIAGFGFLLVMAVEQIAPKIVSGACGSSSKHSGGRGGNSGSSSSSSSSSSNKLRKATSAYGRVPTADEDAHGSSSHGGGHEMRSPASVVDGNEDGLGALSPSHYDPSGGGGGGGGGPSVCSSLTLLLALSFHSVIEGVALGAACDRAAVTQVLLAVMTHKGLAGFALGSQFVKARHGVKGHSLLASVFAASTPIGVGVGAIILASIGGCSGDPDAGEVNEGLILQGVKAVAAGTFLYVAILEVLAGELSHSHAPPPPPEQLGQLQRGGGGAHGGEEEDKPRVAEWLQVLLVVLGYSSMTVLAVWA